MAKSKTTSGQGNDQKEDAQQPQVTIHGYITDPKSVGFQILTNYESTYWARLVGNNDAWRLYEVLRSFCHEGKTTCFPSINYLTEILGLKERRILTGWQKKTKGGKTYTYQGLIEILQKHELLTAEVKGTGKESRYIFHVNLTPSEFTAEQVALLPKLLQIKHAELIKKIETSIENLKAVRRPPKFEESQENTTTASSDEGIGNLPIPIGKLPVPIGKLPEGDYIYINNTKETTSNNNNNKTINFR